MLDARKSLSRSREARSKHVYTDPYQAALLKTFFMPACIGAAISVVKLLRHAGEMPALFGECLCLFARMLRRQLQ